MEMNDRFEVFKEACKAMDEGDNDKAELLFYKLAAFVEKERKVGYDSK